MERKELGNGGFVLAATYIPVLSDAKLLMVKQIKQQANERISSLDWQIKRADRRTALGKIQKKDKALVYQAQHDIEVASDNAELAVNALLTIEEVNAFVW